MIKTITKKMFACDMCGREYTGSKTDLVPKEVFEFTVNLEDGTRTIQICPACQAKLRLALKDKLDSIYEITGCCCILGVKGE